MKQRELIKRLGELGFRFERHGANHDLYTDGKIKIPIPRHKEIKEALAKKILEQAGLK
ncbi:type II toxin-antitoxin system HicA family toxin [Dubosiella newyorkensis]|jgi:mRNA interferase HicA|uniref:type II toxin-antitoxin system HicA family toxin n=1 Tax=Dubosiella newyorkensis TaxID=1862672 RepID=UPI002357DFAA|nr:type II toxin-antitoxin system HicA family toxin [Dubosiella newyorkensis]MCI9042245.1 type II toxin-antitoxin system HicA family toxin [Dubosiella newyorkensis]